MKDVLRLSMIDQAKLIKKGEISPAELLEESIQQIEKVNPKINAVVLPMFDLAREAVSGLSGKEVFSGVPMLLKDVLAEYAGAPMTEGSRFLQGYLSSRDSELVCRYKAAGFIICGRTNSPEFLTKSTCLGLSSSITAILYVPRIFYPTTTLSASLRDNPLSSSAAIREVII